MGFVMILTYLQLDMRERFLGCLELTRSKRAPVIDGLGVPELALLRMFLLLS